jgi:hypothetical protein
MDVRLIPLGVVFATWCVISAFNQFRSGALTLRLRRHLPLGVIPLWTFFAPNPARADTRLIWREEREQQWSGWREVHFGFAPASSRWLLNPELILNKGISDLISSLLCLKTESDDRSHLLTSAYLALLSIVLNEAKTVGCSAVQFAVVRTSERTSPRRIKVAFVSEVHNVCISASHVY